MKESTLATHYVASHRLADLEQAIHDLGPKAAHHSCVHRLLCSFEVSHSPSSCAALQHTAAVLYDLTVCLQKTSFGSVMERLLCSYEVRDSCLLTSAHDAGFFVHDLVVSCIASGKLFNMRDSLSSYAPQCSCWDSSVLGCWPVCVLR